MESEWTIGTLKELMETRFGSQEVAMSAALAAAKEAVSKAEVANEKRFDAVNEFRAQLADQTATLMPRVENEVRLDALAKELSALHMKVDAAAAAIAERRAINATAVARGQFNTTTYIALIVAAFSAVELIIHFLPAVH